MAKHGRLGEEQHTTINPQNSEAAHEMALGESNPPVKASNTQRPKKTADNGVQSTAHPQKKASGNSKLSGTEGMLSDLLVKGASGVAKQWLGKDDQEKSEEYDEIFQDEDEDEEEDDDDDDDEEEEEHSDDEKGKKRTDVKVTQLPENKENASTAKPAADKGLEGTHRLVEILVKCINVLFPLLFIVLGVLHIIKKGRPEDDRFAQAVQEANTIAITAWPIMFAAIATQSLKAYATFKAERGIKLITLEQLLHSSSFSTSLKQPLLLRRIDWMSIMLFGLWGLSPLASQALQRLAVTTPGFTSISQNISYKLVDNSAVNPLPGSTPVEANDTTWNAMFGAALLTAVPIAHSPQDSWGNPKIPSLASLGAASSDGWSAVPTGSNSTVYSSLLGRPFSGIHGTDQTEFTINSSYWAFQCTAPRQASPSDFNQTGNLSYANPTQTLWLGGWNNGIMGLNGTLQLAFLGDSSNNTNFNNNSIFTISNCTFETTAILAHILCEQDSTNCHVDKMQQVQDPSTDIAPGLGITTLAEKLVDAIPSTETNGLTIMAQYLSDPDDIFYKPEGVANRIASLTAEEFSQNVEILINTFVQTSANRRDYIVELNTAVDSNLVRYTEGTSTNVNPVWTIVPVWVALFFFCDLMILLFAIADIFWEGRTISPDFLGFASSIVRNNQRLRQEFQGKKLSGHEKARAMAHMSVLIQDVNSNAKIGKIALAPHNNGSVRLRKGRDYS